MKMELSVGERLTLLVILPKQGNMVTYRLIQGLREVVGFSEAELVKWMPTPCYDINQGCPLCKGTEWESIPFAPIKECKDGECNFRAGMGPPDGTTWRTLDEKGQPIDQMAVLDFGEAGMELIVGTLNLFNKNEELDDNTAPLYVKFVEKDGKQGAIDGAKS